MPAQSVTEEGLPGTLVHMDGRPTGTVTFLFTDIEGSTGSWQADSEAMRVTMERHDSLITADVAQHRGTVILERGEGDSFFAVFARATDALAAACSIQQALHQEHWRDGVAIKVRMAIHTGESSADYRNTEVNRCARLRAIAHGGQVLVSQATHSLVRDTLPAGVTLTDQGEHRLRDLARPERVFQLEHPDLPAKFPPLKSLEASRHNLPVQLTSFVGRQHELGEVKRLVEQQRLVTLTGAGGCGKTRLALQAAADLVDDYADGVWLVELAALADPALLPQAIAGPLKVAEKPDRPLLQVLADELRPKRLVLLLDNCEHLVGASSEATAALLRSCPNLRVLATSREALGVPGEVAWRVPSLSSPDPQRLPGPEALGRYEAVRLFTERASVSQPTFRITEQNAAAVAEICYRLDGVPLAIELAAAHIRVLSPAEILQRLQDRFRLLTAGSRGAVARQQTLRAAVDWSHDLLTEPERQLFRRLSVFLGGFTLEAAEQVCAGGSLAPADVVDLLTRLVDQSLVIADPRPDGSIRDRMLETLRQYGLERLLSSGEADAVQQRHFDHFLQLAEAAYRQRIDSANEWLERLETEHDNLRAALRWSATGRAEAHLRLAGALAWFWQSHCHFSEARDRLSKALAAGSGHSAELARALWGAGVMASWQGDTEAGQIPLKESLRIWRELGNDQEVALALESLGWAQFIGGDDAGALDRFHGMLDVTQELGKPRLVSRARIGICQVLVSLGDVKTAEPMAAQELNLAIDRSDGWCQANAAHFLADCALIREEVNLSEERYQRSLIAWRELGDLLNVSAEMQGIGMSLAGQGRAVKGLRLGGAAAAQWEVLEVNTRIAFWDALLAKWFDRARAHLGPEAAARAWEEGRQMGFDLAVEYALDTQAD